MALTIPARINLVTLGVADLAASSTFYERLGWRRSGRAWEQHVRFFSLDNLVLGLYPRASLAADAAMADTPPGFGGVTLAINVASEAAVDSVLLQAKAAGANLLKPAQRAEWGGYSGYFADADGHPWEVAFNPFFPLDSQGHLGIPD